jgi:hypothetical protein
MYCAIAGVSLAVGIGVGVAGVWDVGVWDAGVWDAGVWDAGVWDMRCRSDPSTAAVAAGQKVAGCGNHRAGD